MCSFQLRNNYRQANVSLTEKASTSEYARARAQQLLHRASVITVSTGDKLAKLKIMDETYHINDKELGELQSRVESLNNDISINLGRIQERSDFYRQCTS